ncbi:MAG TPA: VIT domain-containing protein [Gemmatimonadales bacterium]
MRTLVFAVVFATAAPLAAQGWIEPITPIRPVPIGRVEKVRTAVQVAVTGRVARVTVEEWFRNAGPRLDEAAYLYPLPGEAVFTDYSLWQGDQELRGEMMDASQARSIYETIVRQRRDPALIELAGHGLVRARVFPIAPGETRKITLRYTQILDRVGDAWRFRYAGGPVTAPRSFRLATDSGTAFGDPYSPTHQVRTTRHDRSLEVTLADSATTGDVELYLPLAARTVGLSLVTHRPPGEDGYFMLLLAPGAAADAAALHRDVVAVLDVSGSMSGEKIAQAQAALIQVLGTLRAGDRFRLVAFSNGVRRYRTEWTPLSAESRRDAETWVRGLEAEGGTNIAGALDEAFSQPPADGALGVVVFLTDGLPTVGEQSPEKIADAADQRRGAFRVFSFGLGFDVNTYLLDRLTERARGATEYVRPGGNIEAAVGDLAAKLASPVMTDLTLSADGAELYDVQPDRLPDLFASDEVVVFGRYRGAGNGERVVTVSGRRGGRTERFSAGADFSAEAPQARYIEQLWAARRAGALAQEIRLHGPNTEVLESLKRLALRYGILTEYTSYLVQEPNVAMNGVILREMRPRDQAGAPAVAQAQEQSAMRGALSLQAITVTTGAARADSTWTQAAASGRAIQRVGARVFERRDSVWTDLRHGDSLRVVTVAPFSDAYFALLRALPELVQPAALAPAVLVAGVRVSIKIQEGGRSSWGAGELEGIVRGFRE